MKFSRKSLILSLVSSAVGLGLMYAGMALTPSADGITQADVNNLQRLVLVGVGFIALPPLLMFLAFIIRVRQ